MRSEAFVSRTRVLSRMSLAMHDCKQSATNFAFAGDPFVAESFMESSWQRLTALFFIAWLCMCLPVTAEAQIAGTAQQPIQQVQNQQPVQSQPAIATFGQPFPAQDTKVVAALNQILAAWESHSQGTKTLEADFEHWHYAIKKAPANVHATKGNGVLKYSKPDKGVFKVEELLFFQGLGAAGSPPKFAFGVNPKTGQEIRLGPHWVCNGRELIEYDYQEEKCKIMMLPAGMQGNAIVNSPLPFVFNLDAEDLKRRYWLQLVASPIVGTYLINAFPKTQQDRSQYKLVQVMLDQQLNIQTLVLYPPHFNEKTAPDKDVYQFKNVKRNGVGAAVARFANAFIPAAPPKGWEITREQLPVPVATAPPAARK